MKKSTLILNIVYGVALIALFVLYFTKFSKKAENVKAVSKVAPIPDSILAKPMTIAFVNTDSILTNYKYYKAEISKLERQQASAEAEFTSRYKKLEEDYKNYMTKIKLGLIKQEEAEAQFAEKQKQLEDYYEQLRTSLAEKEQEVSVRLYDSIIGTVQRFNESTNYSYIIAHSKGSNILYADKALDLTALILDELNTSYESWATKKPTVKKKK